MYLYKTCLELKEADVVLRDQVQLTTDIKVGQASLAGDLEFHGRCFRISLRHYA